MPRNEKTTEELGGVGTTTEEGTGVELNLLSFVAVHESEVTTVNLDVRSITSNDEQSRDPLSGMTALGWKLFPNDTERSKKPTPTTGKSVIGELTCGDRTRMVNMLNLLRVHEPEKKEKNIWEMVSSFENNGQLQAIRVHPIYDNDGNAIPNSFNVVLGARRCLTRAIQWAMSHCFRNEDGTFRLLGKEKDGSPEESNYHGLEKTGGLPLILAEMVEGKNAEDEIARSMAENRDRLNANPMDEAIFFARLKKEFGYKPQKIAEIYWGKEAATSSNKAQMIPQRLSLLRLTPDEQERVRVGKLGVVKAIALVKKRAEGDAGATAKDTPGKGERVKMPSVGQARELLNASTPADLSEDVKKRFGKPSLFALLAEDSVRKFISECCGEKFETRDKMLARKAKEAEAAEKEKENGKGKGKGKKGSETPDDGEGEEGDDAAE